MLALRCFNTTVFPVHPDPSDPNNHVPEVTPGDSWDDVIECPSDDGSSIATLPRKRPTAERSFVEVPEEEDHPKLRVEPDLIREGEPIAERQLEVQEISDEVIRLEITPPAILKPDRKVAFQEKEDCVDDVKNPRGEAPDWGVADPKPKRWLLGSGAAVVGIIILLMLFLPKFNEMNASKSDSEKGVVKVETEEKIKGLEAMDRLLLKQTEAMQIYRDYTRATHFDEILPLLRGGANLKETLRTAWRPMRISKQWVPAADSDWNVTEHGGHPYAILEGSLPDQSHYTAYFTNDGNRLLLDWKATTAYGTATFEDLAENTGNAEEIRGMISIAAFYSEVWPEAIYQSYRLISPDGVTSLWCYTRRDDPSGTALAGLFPKSQILEEPQGSKKITLRLKRGPTASRPNQWLIREMLHIDWLTP